MVSAFNDRQLGLGIEWDSAHNNGNDPHIYISGRFLQTDWRESCSTLRSIAWECCHYFTRIHSDISHSWNRFTKCLSSTTRMNWFHQANSQSTFIISLNLFYISLKESTHKPISNNRSICLKNSSFSRILNFFGLDHLFKVINSRSLAQIDFNGELVVYSLKFRPQQRKLRNIWLQSFVHFLYLET